MKIGITERGDAGLMVKQWKEKLEHLDGAILITKNPNPEFQQAVLDAHKVGHKLIVHVTCTGWGGTYMEPNVPKYGSTLIMLQNLIKNGFPKEQCVLRIDPIIPNKEGLEHVSEVIELAYKMRLVPNIRVRISILDEYPHVRERLQRLEKPPIYGGNLFYAPLSMMRDVKTLLSQYDITYECCAEPVLTEGSEQFVATGCISQRDLYILGIENDTEHINPQNRKGCLCLSGKKELLTCKSRCAHGCAYCYWKDK